MRVSAWLGVVGAACASCTLLVDTTGLDDGERGATTTAEGGAPEASVDAGTGPFPDPCIGPGILVCEKFDDAASVGKYQSDTDLTTSIAPDEALFTSPPLSARFTISPSDSNGSPDATITIRPAGTLTDFSVEGKVHIERREPGGAARLFFVAPLVDGGTGEPILVDHSGAVKNGGPIANVGVFELGRWYTFRVEVRASTQPAQAVIDVGGTNVSVTLAKPWAPAPVLIRLGVSEANSPTSGWIVRWDDIVVKKL